MRTLKIKALMYSAMATVSVLAFTVEDAFAQASSTSTVGDTATKVLSQVTNVGKLAVGGAFLLGIIMVAGGLLKLKAASESQGQQTPYSSGLWRLALGAGLVALPALTGMLTTSGNMSASTITNASGF